MEIKTRQDIEELTVGADCGQTMVMFGGDAANVPVISTYPRLNPNNYT